MTPTPRANRTRQETALAWTSSHAAELAGVAVPLIGGAVFTPWLNLISVAWAALWAANEIRLHRATRAARRAALATPSPHRQLSTTATSTDAAETTNRQEAKA